jgi:DNA-binding NarL/FixJ family response regulator
MAKMRILVVDDYQPFRRFICSTLVQRSGLQVVGEASDGLEAVQKSQELQPDLIVLDLGLPKLNGIEAARQIRERSATSKILIVSQESSADIVHEAVSAGVLGYVIKGCAGRELLPAVEAVLRGELFMSTSLLPSTKYAQGPSGSEHPGGTPPVVPQRAESDRTTSFNSRLMTNPV